MSRITYGTGDAYIEVNDTTAALVRAVADKVAPGAFQLIEDETRTIYDDAKRQWPVGPYKRYRPGHSRDFLFHEMSIRGDTIRGRVYCTADWSRYIKPKGLRGKTAYVVYLQRPIRKLRGPMLEQLGRFIVKELETA